MSRRQALALGLLVPAGLAAGRGAGVVEAGRLRGPTAAGVRGQAAPTLPAPLRVAVQGSEAGPRLTVELVISAAVDAVAVVNHPDGSTTQQPLLDPASPPRGVPIRTRPGSLRDQAVAVELRWRAGADTRSYAARPIKLGGLSDASVRKTLLPSGLLVLTVERLDAETVGVNVAVNAGMRDEDASLLGAAHWLEHVHFLGSVDHPDPNYFSRLFDGLGGESNAWTWIEQTHYWVAVPKAQLVPAMSGLAEMITGPVFNPAAVDSERRVVAREEAIRLNTPTTAVLDAMYPLIFKEHPARYAGAKAVPDVRIDAMVAFRNQRYVSGNLVVGVVGAVSHDEAVELASTRFSGIPMGQRIERTRLVEPKLTEIRRVEQGNGRNQAQVAVGWPTAGLDSRDRYAFMVLDAIMDQPGRRLSRSLRTERQLATNAGTAFEQFSDVGYWIGRAQTSPERAEACLAALLDEVRRLQTEGPTADEVRDAIGFVQGAKLLAGERSGDQADRMTEGEIIGALESVDDLVAGLGAVTPDDVRRFAAANFDVQRYAAAIVRY